LRMFLEQKNPEFMTKAVGSFNQAIKNDPKLASAYNGRASAFKFSNRIGEAIQDWNTALKLQPDFADVYFNLGITYLQTGNKSEALEILSACKEKLFNRLPPSEQRRLDRLIAEASQ
jgi:tetratricopeptide (TPR) repeat protein